MRIVFPLATTAGRCLFSKKGTRTNEKPANRLVILDDVVEGQGQNTISTLIHYVHMLPCEHLLLFEHVHSTCTHVFRKNHSNYTRYSKFARFLSSVAKDGYFYPILSLSLSLFTFLYEVISYFRIIRILFLCRIKCTNI